MNNSIKEVLDEYIFKIEAKLKEYSLKKYVGMQKNICEVMDYSLEGGGKRIRPVLIIEFCRLCGGDINTALIPACALEMIHTFSLIHDDLPCMDNDDYRRGKLSCHKKFGETLAVLAGDALAVRPFEIISNASDLSAEAKIKIISELAYSTGVQGMIGGQVIDIENEKRANVDESNLREMYALKTGALIRSACKIGCFCANSDDKKIKLADEYAKCLGTAFQIIDDILDVTSSSDVLGKPVGSDAEQNKTTFVTLLGLNNAKREAEILTDKAIEILENFNDNTFIKELTYYLLKREY